MARRWLHLALEMLAVLLLPYLLLILALRIATLPWLPRLIYAWPSFPADRYGLTRAQRIELADHCLAELNSPRGPERFRVARLPDGGRAFTPAEQAHMDDVRRLYDHLTRLALLLVPLEGLLFLWQRRRGGRAALGRLLIFGGGLTLVLLLLLGIGMLLGWERFFVGLHHLFFAEGTWRFAYDSTLIRLFPERFWQMAAATVALLLSLLALGAMLLGWHWQRDIEPAEMGGGM